MCSDWLRIASYLAIITPCEVIIILTETPIFRVAKPQFLDVFEENVSEIKENTLILL